LAGDKPQCALIEQLASLFPALIVDALPRRRPRTVSEKIFRVAHESTSFHDLANLIDHGEGVARSSTARRNRLHEVSYLTAVKRVLSKLYRRLMIEKLEHLPIPDG
jgi:hypothetical protein